MIQNYAQKFNCIISILMTLSHGQMSCTWGPMLTLYFCCGESPATRKELEPDCWSRYSFTRLAFPTRFLNTTELLREVILLEDSLFSQAIFAKI